MSSGLQVNFEKIVIFQFFNDPVIQNCFFALRNFLYMRKRFILFGISPEEMNKSSLSFLSGIFYNGPVGFFASLSLNS